MSLAFCPSRAIFDVETARIDNPYNAPVTVVSIITTNPFKLYQFEEENIRDAVDILLATPGIVTFNGRKFDVPVMLKYMSRGEGRLFRAKPHFDIFDEYVRLKPGMLISLDNIAKSTLNMQKQDIEDSAIQLAKTNPRRLATYNARDTLLTYYLYVYMCSFGKLYATLPRLHSWVPETISRPSRL